MSDLLPDPRQGDAAALIARVASSAASGVARRALVLRLSQLPSALSRPHHLRLARAALDPLRGADRAEAFELPNADTAVLWRGRGDEALRASLAAVSELFAGGGAATPDPGGLCLLLDLPEQAETLLRLARDSRDRAAAPPGPDPRPGLDAAGLAALEAALAQADLARFVRRHPVCAAGSDGAFHPAWDYWSLSVTELEAALAPGHSLRAEPFLFRRLTRTLAQRVLALLAGPGELHGAGPLALDLSVSSLLGREFLRFDAALPAGLRGRVVLGLEGWDILADLPAFRFARDFALARGYRLLLHDPGAGIRAALPPERLGIELLQLCWPAASDAVGDAGFDVRATRLVLAGADAPEAIAWGRRHGVALFAGRAIIAAARQSARTR